jgi:hypothetical protein
MPSLELGLWLTMQSLELVFRLTMSSLDLALWLTMQSLELTAQRAVSDIHTEQVMTFP